MTLSLAYDRWSSVKDLEGCTESGTWAPIRVCDRMCGFAGPPLPTLRLPERGGAIECSVTHCTPTCTIRNNPHTAPELSGDTCRQLIDDFADHHPEGPSCRNLTVADVINNDLSSRDHQNAAGIELVKKLYPASYGAGLKDIYMDGFPTFKASTVVLCTASPGETCETFTDRQSVCAKEVDYFPFEKNPAIQRSTSLYLLKLDSVFPSPLHLPQLRAKCYALSCCLILLSRGGFISHHCNALCSPRCALVTLYG